MATKISLKQLGPDILALLGGGGGSLIRDINSNVAVGAAPAGTLFPQGQDLTTFAETLLLKDITPTVSTSFSGSGVKEVGTQVNGSTMSLTISNLKSVTVPINKVEFFDGNTLLDSQAYVEGKATYSYVYSKVISTNTTLKAVLTYAGGRTAQGTGAFTFVYGSFYGVTQAAFIDSSIANSLIASFTKSIKDSKALTWNNITLNDEKFCYLYPASYGALGSIKDGNGFSQLDSYTRYQIDITYPTNSQKVSYYAYLLTDAATGTGFTQIYQ